MNIYLKQYFYIIIFVKSKPTDIDHFKKYWLNVLKESNKKY